MPITQSRIIALIKAGFDYKHGLESLLNLIHSQQTHLEAGNASPEQVLNILLPSAKLHFLLTEPVQSAITLIGEEKHFRLHGKRNIKKAQKIRENKIAAKEGRPRPQRSTTAPARIDQAHGQKPNVLTHSLRINAADAQLDQDLELGDFGGTESSLPPDYIPGPLTDKQKAEVEEFSKQRESAKMFMPLEGFTLPQSICAHDKRARQESGVCGDCGKEIAQPGEG